MIWKRKKRHKPSRFQHKWRQAENALEEGKFQDSYPPIWLLPLFSGSVDLMPLCIPPWPPRWPEIEQAAVEAIRSGQWGNYHSEVCQALKKRLERRFQSTDVRLLCSGSVAVEIALRAAGVGPGDEVIVAAYDYPGNFRSIELVGARPVLVDIASNSIGPDYSGLLAAGASQVRAVIASHLYGVATEIDQIRQLCDERGWILIEDACQVPGMTINGRPAGSFGHLGTLSFGGSKPLTSGCGGALLTSDPRLAARIGPLIDRPSDGMPLSPLQAAVLHPQLDKLDEWNRRRTETITFLETKVIPNLPNWNWQSPLQDDVTPAHYKVAWTAPSHSDRQRIVETATELGLPIGEGFHAMSRSSERRCRKPVPLERSTEFGETLFVLDHRALLIDSDHHTELGNLLVDLHDRFNAAR